MGNTLVVSDVLNMMDSGVLIQFTNSCMTRGWRHNFSVIGISETWCQDYNVSSCDLPGYKAEHIYRHTKVGGGVALYIKDNIAYHTRLDITKLNDYIECQFIEIHKDSNSYGKDIIVGVIYRPPNNDINK